MCIWYVVDFLLLCDKFYRRGAKSLSAVLSRKHQGRISYICRMATTLKQQLYTLCREYIARSMSAAEQAIADAREAMANETKSSAGDKYETTREMMQQDIDMNTMRLSEAQKLKAALDTIDPEAHHPVVGAGSLVYTTQGNYFVSISIGKLVIDGLTYYALSSSAPLGNKLVGLKAGDMFSFNGKEIKITEVV
jgi:transcription elongation GreA/GreB family factor